MERSTADAWAARLVAWHNRHPLARRIGVGDLAAPGYVELPFSADRRRRVFAERFLPRLALRTVARFAARHGHGQPPPDDGLPRRLIAPDPRLAGSQPLQPLWLATVAVGRHRVLLAPGAGGAVLGHRHWSAPRAGAAALALLLLGAVPLLPRLRPVADDGDGVEAAAVVAAAAAPSAAAANAGTPPEAAEAHGTAPPAADRHGAPYGIAAHGTTSPVAAEGHGTTPQVAAEAQGTASQADAEAHGTASHVGTAASAKSPTVAAGDTSPAESHGSPQVAAAPHAAPPASARETQPAPAPASSAHPESPPPTAARSALKPRALLPPRPQLDEATKTAAREAGQQARAARAVAAGGPVYALATQRVRTQAESELLADALRALAGADAPRGWQVEALPAGDDWRAVGWPFVQRADAERLRDRLAARGHRIEVVAF